MVNYMQVARGTAKYSPDPSTKVGAVITQGVFYWKAHNDFPPGIPDSWWRDRELKYRAVVHAEVAVLLKAGSKAAGGTMYITHHPCRDCAKIIAAAGIQCVVCPSEPWRDDPEVRKSCRDAAELLEYAGVEVRYEEKR